MNSRGRFMLVLIIVAFLASAQAYGQTYPGRPVTMIVPMPPGGPMDLTARMLAESVKPYLPQPVIVVNKAGGAGVIGINEAVQSAHDGYTLGLLAGNFFTYGPYLQDYPFKGGTVSLQPIITGTDFPLILYDRPDAPWKTFKEMLDYAKANPGKIRIGHAGVYGAGHLTLELMKQSTGANVTIVPYNGFAPLVAALMGGHVEGACINPGPGIGHMKAGKVRFLLAFSEKRLPDLPDVPSVREAGYNFRLESSYYFVGGPKGLSKEVVQTLYAAFRKGKETEQFQEFSRKNLSIVNHASPEEMADYLNSAHAFYAEFSKKLK